MTIHIFSDTNMLPRDLARVGHEYEQLAELVDAKLVMVHMSDIAMREWITQRVHDYLKLVKEMHSKMRSVMHQPWSEKLMSHKTLSGLAKKQNATIKDAERIITRECDVFFSKLGVSRVEIDGGDATKVFDNYFSGGPPFSEKKNRGDLPDAFILEAARRIILTIPRGELHVICADKRLSKSLARLSSSLSGYTSVEVHSSVKSFLESKIAKDAMMHLAFYNVWTKKADVVMSFLARQQKFARKKIEHFASDTLTGYTMTDYSIPVDNNEAYIACTYGCDDLDFDWESADNPGPGWITVPFVFTTDAELEFMVFRMDAFGMPDWMDVSLGDFEEDYYFEATASRQVRVKGRLSFLYTKKELEGEKLKLPKNVEVEDDFEVELVEDESSDGLCQ